MGAIDFTQTAEKIEVNVGAVILSPGIEPFDPRVMNEYRYGQFDNVVTSMDYERLLCATGPYQGEVLREFRPEAPPEGGLAPMRRFPAGAGGGQQLLFRRVLHLHPEAGDPDQGARRGSGVYGVPQRHPILRQGFRALLREDGRTAGRPVLPELRRNRTRGPGDKERNDTLQHPRRRRERGRVRHGGAVGRTESPERRAGAGEQVRHRAQCPRVQRHRSRQPHGDEPARRLRQRRLPGPHRHPRVGLHRQRGRVPVRRTPEPQAGKTGGGTGVSARKGCFRRPASDRGVRLPLRRQHQPDRGRSLHGGVCPDAAQRGLRQRSSCFPAPPTRPRRLPTWRSRKGSIASSSQPVPRGPWRRCSGIPSGRRA